MNFLSGVKRLCILFFRSRKLSCQRNARTFTRLGIHGKPVRKAFHDGESHAATIFIGTSCEKRGARLCDVFNTTALIRDDDTNGPVFKAFGDERDHTDLSAVGVNDAVGNGFAHGTPNIGKLLYVGVERKKKTRNDASRKRFIFGSG